MEERELSINEDKYIKLSLKDKDKIYMELCININKKIEHINLNKYDELVEIKNKINCSDWDKNKRFCNDYELIHISNKKISNGIALYEPLSRSYFKMVEMIFDFDLLNSEYLLKNNIILPEFKSAHIAEGPGGFLESTYNLSHNLARFKKYSHHAITLLSNDFDIPGWRRARSFINSDNDIKISYGEDGTGNIYDIKNIKNFVNTVGIGSCNLITADGGFDFSKDFNKQEHMSYKLILCEIIIALYLQKNGGHFVCKIFDSFSIPTVKLIYFLSCFYKEVYINKPVTSRPANSEKYIVAKDFIGIEIDYLNNLLDLLNIWNKLNLPFIHDIFTGDIPEYFIVQIEKYNIDNSDDQIISINNAIKFIENKVSLTVLDNVISNQVNKAMEWCDKYNEKININSSFIKNIKISKYKY